jgi:hypothetical protein
VRPIPIAGVLCAVVVIFYCAYTRSHEAVGVGIVAFMLFVLRAATA